MVFANGYIFQYNNTTFKSVNPTASADVVAVRQPHYKHTTALPELIGNIK